jgi:hypothetical protein
MNETHILIRFLRTYEPSVSVLQDDFSSGTFIAQCTTKLEWCLDMSIIYGFPRFQKSIYLSITAVAVFRKPNAIPLCFSIYINVKSYFCRSQLTRGLWRRSRAARLLRSWVRIPPKACCVCCMLSGRGLCDELITRPWESYRLWRVVVWIKKHRKREGHSPRWAAEPDKINNKNNNN